MTFQCCGTFWNVPIALFPFLFLNHAIEIFTHPLMNSSSCLSNEFLEHLVLVDASFCTAINIFTCCAWNTIPPSTSFAFQRWIDKIYCTIIKGYYQKNKSLYLSMIMSWTTIIALIIFHPLTKQQVATKCWYALVYNIHSSFTFKKYFLQKIATINTNGGIKYIIFSTNDNNSNIPSFTNTP